MTFKEFYISDKNGKSNCVIRSLCKILNKEIIPSSTIYKYILRYKNRIMSVKSKLAQSN